MRLIKNAQVDGKLSGVRIGDRGRVFHNLLMQMTAYYFSRQRGERKIQLEIYWANTII